MKKARKLSKSDQGTDEEMRMKVINGMRADIAAKKTCQLDHEHFGKFPGSTCIPSNIKLGEE